ncbi:hypothetical protein EGR_06433 [Echinococcus granulosus]|uniref:Uncharacterized protein n=1 Tax=Echinococcus granulosus TaxID=6210 RepID=W6UKZ1_ECHGR|nr:hypothetical protein EGR_06433 [Echinococcus granulosus]EUB58762.1 hypothetical protein EGR_06433 [Echinococcus granulosus]
MVLSADAVASGENGEDWTKFCIAYLLCIVCEWWILDPLASAVATHNSRGALIFRPFFGQNFARYAAVRRQLDCVVKQTAE